MMFSCYACHGLGIVQPINDLAAWLNAHTPQGIHFNIVGGADPQVEQMSINNAVFSDLARGGQLIFIGHSKGAMLAYYLAQDLEKAKLKAPLFVAIDPVQWSSNLPGCTPWLVQANDKAGRWEAPNSIGRFINFRQPGYPGGGVLVNVSDRFTDVLLTGVDHMSIPNAAQVREIILQAVLDTHSHFS